MFSLAVLFLSIYLSFIFAETERGIFDAILEGVIDFESQPWPSISDSAKDLVRKMLTQDPRKRITSAEVLGILSLKYYFGWTESFNYVKHAV